MPPKLADELDRTHECLVTQLARLELWHSTSKVAQTKGFNSITVLLVSIVD